MDKIVVVQDKVDDLYGLYMDLRRSEFSVKNVGADQRGTYVYVDEAESKDVVPVVKAWVGKVPQELSASLRKKRIKEYQQVLDAEEKAREVKRLVALEEAKKLGADGGMELIGGTGNTSIAPSVPAPVGLLEIKDEDGVIGELIGGAPGNESVFKRIWKKLF